MARRKHRPSGRETRKSTASDGVGRDAGGYWLCGIHAVEAALANPNRSVGRLLLSEEAATRLRLPATAPTAETASRRQIAEHLPANAVHQGVALLTEPLPEVGLEAALARGAGQDRRVVLLDRVNDPQNVGAVLRSAAAFDATAVVLTRRHAPPEGAALAKAASGALERVPLVRVANLARALEDLARLGFWRIGLDAGAEASLPEADMSGDVALVLGAEGSGLRRLTAAGCDQLARLEMAQAATSLNVSAAAAIALFLAYRATR